MPSFCLHIGSKDRHFSAEITRKGAEKRVGEALETPETRFEQKKNLPWGAGEGNLFERRGLGQGTQGL